MKKFTCPKCDGNIVYWNEYYFEKYQKINPQTGKLSKRVYKSEECDDVDHEGFRCEVCGWVSNTINDVFPEHLEEWHDKNKGKLKIYSFELES